MIDIVQGTRIELKHDKDIFVSYIHKIQKKEIVIESPKHYNKEIKLDIDKIYSVILFVEGSLLSCDCKVDIFLSNGLMLYRLMPLTKIERVKRRKHNHFSIILPITFIHNNIECNGIIKDISQGGIRFVSNKHITEENINFVIKISEIDLKMQGRVLSQLRFPKSNYRYQYRIEFNNVTLEQSEAIKNFVFNNNLKEINRESME